MGHTSTPYAAIGGAPAIRLLVDKLYDEILADPLLAPYFTGHDVSTLKRHMAGLLTQTLGGPKAYAGRALAEVHHPLNITPGHFLRVVNIATGAMFLLHLPTPLINDARDALLRLYPHIVPEELRMESALDAEVAALLGGSHGDRDPEGGGNPDDLATEHPYGRPVETWEMVDFAELERADRPAGAS